MLVALCFIVILLAVWICGMIYLSVDLRQVTPKESKPRQLKKKISQLEADNEKLRLENAELKKYNEALETVSNWKAVEELNAKKE